MKYFSMLVFFVMEEDVIHGKNFPPKMDNCNAVLGKCIVQVNLF